MSRFTLRRADADRDASHPDVAHHVGGIQQRPAEGGPPGTAHGGEDLPGAGRPPGPPLAAPPAPPGPKEGEPAGGGRLGGRLRHQQDRRHSGQPGQSSHGLHLILH